MHYKEIEGYIFKNVVHHHIPWVNFIECIYQSQGAEVEGSEGVKIISIYNVCNYTAAQSQSQ